MYILRDLVKFKNELRDSIGQLSLNDAINEKLSIIKNFKVKHSLPQYDQDIDNFATVYDEVILKNQNVIETIENCIQKVDQEIEQILFSNRDEYKIKLNEANVMSTFLSTNDTLEKIICNRISSYSNWKYPGLQLHCRYYRPEHPQKILSTPVAEPLHRINSMVGTDPLYLAGFDKNWIAELINIYPSEYQRRLRLYEIKERDLSVLPHNQFGLILCWDFLNYLTIEAIDFYLKKILTLLRPGGVCFFSYNNCERERSAQLVDEKLATWTTLPIIEKMVIDLGFEIIRFLDYETNDDSNTWVSWAEIRKPGELHTTKRSQAMGSIRTK